MLISLLWYWCIVQLLICLFETTLADHSSYWGRAPLSSKILQGIPVTNLNTWTLNQTTRSRNVTISEWHMQTWLGHMCSPGSRPRFWKTGAWGLLTAPWVLNLISIRLSSAKNMFLVEVLLSNHVAAFEHRHQVHLLRTKRLPAYANT